MHVIVYAVVEDALSPDVARTTTAAAMIWASDV